MKKKVLMSLVLLAMTSLVFAQVPTPTLNKLQFTIIPGVPESTFASGLPGRGEVKAANNSISEEVVIPHLYNGQFVTDIVANAFQNCTRITTVDIPGTVNNIGANAFRGCTNLNEVLIGSYFGTWIKANAFAGCTNLLRVTIGGWVDIENANAFPGDLRAKYMAGGPGAYSRSRGSNTWTKDKSAATCPGCWYSHGLDQWIYSSKAYDW